MLLITEELLGTTQTTIEESTEGKKNLYIEGIFMQAEKKNKNGRIYPRGILENQVNLYNESFVKTNRALGELNHPQRPSVDPEFASHRIVELKREGDNFIGKALILNTPKGNIVRGLLEGGTSIGVSSRGLGSVKTNKNGINEVQSDFRLVTVDIVANPSAPDAFVNGILEGKNWAVESIGEESFEKVRKLIKKVNRNHLEEMKIKLFSDIFK